MTVDAAPGGGQGERLRAFLYGPFLEAKGAVNVDLLHRRMSRSRLLALRDRMLEGAALVDDILGGGKAE